MDQRNDAATRADIEKTERHADALHYTAQHIGDGERAIQDGAIAATAGQIFANWLEGVKPNAGDLVGLGRVAADGVRHRLNAREATRSQVSPAASADRAASPDRQRSVAPDSSKPDRAAGVDAALGRAKSEVRSPQEAHGPSAQAERANRAQPSPNSARTDAAQRSARPETKSADGEAIPRGMSRNEMKESLSAGRYGADVSVPNTKQPGLDLASKPSHQHWDQSVDRKTHTVEVTHAVEGGTWVQLKRLDEPSATLGTRIDRNIQVAMEKFDSVLKDGSSKTSILADGTRLTETYKAPEALHIDLEVEGFSRLATAEQQSWQQRADATLSGWRGGWGAPADTFMGKTVTVKVLEAP